MIELVYGTKGFAEKAWKEIQENRPVALMVFGRKRTHIDKLLSKYAEYDQLSRKGNVPKGLLLSLGLRSIFAISFMGLCHHARSSGMTISTYEKGPVLEVRFTKPMPPGSLI